MQNFNKYLESLDEGKIVIKRRYTENHPEKNVRKGANIRNTIIEALRDKKLTLSEFNEIVAQHSKSPNKWTQRNKRFFTIKEDNVTLSRYGNKIAKTLQPVNEGREKPFRKVKAGDVGQDYNGEDVTIVAVGKLGKLMKYDDTGMAEDGLSQGYLNKNDDAVAVESPEGGYALFTYGDDGVVVNESLTNTSDILDRVADIDDILMNTKNRRAKKDWEEYTEDLFADYEDEAGEEVTWDDMEMDDHLTSIDVGEDIMNRYKIKESVVNEGRAKATQMLKDVAKGFASEVEGIKLSKEMAQAYLDWLSQSAYGKKYNGLPFEHIFKASFNWGIDRYTKDLKGEYKELKQQAKAMKESTIYTDFSSFVNESYMAEEEVNEAFKVGDYIKHTAQRKTVFAKIVKAGKKSASIAILGRGGADDKQPTSRKETWQGGSYVDFGKHSKKELDDIAKTLSPGSGYKYSDMEAWNIQESVEINEALKSSKLRNLLSMKKSPKDLFKAIYGATKIALDKVEDHQVVDVDPKQGPKQDGYVFYYTTQEKENPYAKDTYWNAKFPANTLLALAKGKKVFYVKNTWQRRGPSNYSLTTDPKGGFSRNMSASDIGPNKSYSGYDASGLGSLARVISIADAAFVVNPDALETTHDKIEQRVKAKEGAIAFQDPKEFKNTNLARYKEILTQRSESLDVDKEIEKAINDIADVMKDGIKNKKRNRYGEVIMGTGQDGKDFKMNDLTNFTTRLMDDYQRWSGHMADVERAKEALKKGDDSGSRRGDEQWEVKYYTKQALEYAKEIKDRLRKLKKKNLAW
mgnify:CR=1 FL=1